MPAKRTSSAAKSTSKKSKTSSQASGWQGRYLQLRSQIEAMQELHALLLVIMTILAASLTVVLVNQQVQIKALRFERDFIESRYRVAKEFNDRLREEKNDLAE